MPLVAVRTSNGSRRKAFLRDHLGATKLTKIPIENGKKLANLWVWRNHEKWAAMKKVDVGRQYDARPKL